MPCVKLKNKQKIYQLALSLISLKYTYKKALQAFLFTYNLFYKSIFVQHTNWFNKLQVKTKHNFI